MSSRFDWLTFAAFFCLGLLSIALLYPYSFTQGQDFAFRQSIFFIAGGVIIFLFSNINVSFFKKNSWLIFTLYLLGIFILLAVLFLGKRFNGASSWFLLWRFGLEPAEFMKILLIFLLSRYFTYRHLQLYRPLNIALSFFYILIPAILVALQPDLGAAIIILALWLGMVIMAGMKWSHLSLVILAGVFIAGFAWLYLLLPYQKVRVLSFLNPNADPLGASYSRNQSLIAIGAGGIFGKGIGNNTHSLDGFLPESHTDFIFATLAESMGLSGIIILFALLGIICWRLFRFEGKSNFDRLFSSGLGWFIFIQACINIGINVGFLPVTGLTLPFLSYGGSSLISLCMGLGIYQALYAQS